MIPHVCLNQKCGKTYFTNSERDTGCCSFECWEVVNCQDPQDFEEVFIPNEVKI